MATQKMNAKALRRIMQKRTLVLENSTGRKVVLTVQGDGKVIDVTNAKGELVESFTEPGTVLQKKIINFKANSELAMRNPQNIQLLKDGISAERSGDNELAHNCYTQYLNRVQLSVSILLPSRLADRMLDRIDIAAKVEKISTEKGALLTITPDSISVQEPLVLATTNFDLEKFVQEPEEDFEVDLEPTPIPEGESIRGRKAREAFDRGRGVEPLVSVMA